MFYIVGGTRIQGGDSGHNVHCSSIRIHSSRYPEGKVDVVSSSLFLCFPLGFRMIHSTFFRLTIVTVWLFSVHKIPLQFLRFLGKKTHKKRRQKELKKVALVWEAEKNPVKYGQIVGGLFVCSTDRRHPILACLPFIAADGQLREEHKTPGDHMSRYQGGHVCRQGSHGHVLSRR